jgi:hypothetical protein
VLVILVSDWTGGVSKRLERWYNSRYSINYCTVL